jgi:hypothetical protein
VEKLGRVYLCSRLESLRSKAMGFFDNLKNKVLDTGTSDNGSGIRLDPESQRIEEEKYIEITNKVIEELGKSGFFKPEKISFIADKIRNTAAPGRGFSVTFSGDDLLSVDEKKSLGLNARQKYSREFIDCLTPSGLKHEEPKSIIEDTWYKHFHSVCRKYDILRFKNTGIKKVEIIDCGDERDCSKIKKLKKVWSIDEVPELPLPGCTAKYCRCSYAAKDIF